MMLRERTKNGKRDLVSQPVMCPASNTTTTGLGGFHEPLSAPLRERLDEIFKEQPNTKQQPPAG
ncbi:hypothetical protein ACHAXS_012315 [Conticribra weissflogii]